MSNPKIVIDDVEETLRIQSVKLQQQLQRQIAQDAEIFKLQDQNKELAQAVIVLKRERDALTDQLATLEADVLQREAQLILTAHQDPSAMMSRQTIGTMENIAAVMKTRAALIKAQAQMARAKGGE